MSEKTPKQLRNERLAKTVIKALESRHFEPYYFEKKEDAVSKILELIPDESSISWGGTTTGKEMGLFEALYEKNTYNLIDREKATSPEEVRQKMIEAFGCDFYITGINGMSQDGILINVDKNGNRVGALCYGPKNVIALVGVNKIVKTADDALSRARNEAAPINQLRFQGKTPCTETGVCSDCKSTESICAQIVETRLSMPPKRIKVIIIGEELGF